MPPCVCGRGAVAQSLDALDELVVEEAAAVLAEPEPEVADVELEPDDEVDSEVEPERLSVR